MFLIFCKAQLQSGCNCRSNHFFETILFQSRLLIKIDCPIKNKHTLNDFTLSSYIDHL